VRWSAQVFVHAVHGPAQSAQTALLLAISPLLFGFAVINSIHFDGDVVSGIGYVDRPVGRPQFQKPAVAEHTVQTPSAERRSEVSSGDWDSSASCRRVLPRLGESANQLSTMCRVPPTPLESPRHLLSRRWCGVPPANLCAASTAIGRIFPLVFHPLR